MSLHMLMQSMPMQEMTKTEFVTELMAFTMPIFKDRCVFILMVLITIFDLESGLCVKRIQNRFLTFLRKYLQEHSKNDVNFDMQNVTKCIAALPRIYKIFQEMGPKNTVHKALDI